MFAPDDHLGIFAALMGISALAFWLERTRLGALLTGTVIVILLSVLAANVGLIPHRAMTYDFVFEYLVPILIPLFLLQGDIRRLYKEAYRTTAAFMIASAGTVLGVLAAISLLDLSAVAIDAGIDPDQQADAGWGRTFARWAWPFGEDDNNATSEALLEEEYEPALETDPWWWPFWSEKTPAQENHADATTGIDEADALALTEEQAESAPLEVMEESTEDISAREAVEAPKAEKKRSSARDWVWPF